MIQATIVPVTPFQQNCSILWCERTKKAAVVDPGGDLDRILATVAELGRVVRPGGRLALLEVAEPPNPIMRMGHGIYFGRVVPVIGGILSNGRAYSYLPRSVEYLPEPAELLDVVRDGGFRDVDRTLLSGGIAQLITATRVL